MKKKGFTLIELLVVIAIIAMLLAILMPALNKVKKIAMRVICGTNLKGLGTAQNVYANDYDDEYTVQGGGGAHTWAVVTATTGGTSEWQVQSKNWLTAGTITVGASLYLLVREADVSPKSFVCPASSQAEFSGKNSGGVSGAPLDLTALWDFGRPEGVAPLQSEGPDKCVSYSYHQPYVASDTTQTGKTTGQKGAKAATGGRSASFAMMADRNPFFDVDKLTIGGATAENFKDKARGLNWVDTAQRWETQAANTQPHDREGQNVTYADGHNSYETRTDVGSKNDNIYTTWTSLSPVVEGDRRTGTVPSTGNRLNMYPRGSEDSVLVNDRNY